MSEEKTALTRRELLKAAGKAGAVSLVASPLVELALGEDGTLSAQAVRRADLNAVAGPDRVVMSRGKTYLNAWVGYGQPPRRERRRPGGTRAARPAEPPPGPPPAVAWSKLSGPGTVTFARPECGGDDGLILRPWRLRPPAGRPTTAARRSTSTLAVKVELPPPPVQLSPVVTRFHTVTDPFWASRTKALITSWIPHCVAQIERTDIPAGRGDGGIDNFIEAAKALRGEPHAAHKGYVFSNAWVHQTVESICLALMIDPQGDAGDRRRAEEDARHAGGLDPEDPRRAASRRLPADRLHAARHGAGIGHPRRGSRAVDGALVARRAGQPRRLRGRLLHRVGDQPLRDDRRQGPPPVQRREEAGRLLGRQHRPGAQAGVVRRPPGDGAGARAVRPLRQRGGEEAGRQTGRATGTSRSRSSCSTAARAARSTTRATCPCSSSTRRSGTPSAPSTPTPAWPTSRWRPTTWTTRAP